MENRIAVASRRLQRDRNKEEQAKNNDMFSAMLGTSEHSLAPKPVQVLSYALGLIR